MTRTVEQAIGQKLMLAFPGITPPAEILQRLKTQHVGGYTLFRALNVENPDQVRALTTTLQQAASAAGQPPLLIAADQEGGQLMALGEGLTPFPGNMALGAAGSADLAYQAGLATGKELAALGVNVNYAPSCDVNSNPENPVIGTRSFGEDAGLVARLAAALIQGMQAAGVACVAKHFPGHGDTVQDSHHGTPLVRHTRARLRQVELPPFAAAIEAGSKLIMTAHLGIPALNEGLSMPATLSRPVMHDLLRQEMGFEGVVVSDAMDMGAIAQGAGLAIDVIAATLAGVDLLLMTADLRTHRLAYDSLVQAYGRALIPEQLLLDSADRILALKQWLAKQKKPDRDVISCAEHQALAYEIAKQAVTLVRNDAGLLPLQLDPEARLAVIMPQPKDLTPADTSSYVKPTLAQAARSYHAWVDEFITSHLPTEPEIAALREKASAYDLLLVGTINASVQPEQAALVKELLATTVPTVTIALRTPYDLAAYPQAATHVCTYSIQESAMRALAAVLWGEVPFRGKLPTQIPGLYRRGHGLT